MTQVHVSHHQFQVRTGIRTGQLPLFTVGDGLVQLTGDGTLTVFTGRESARLPVRVISGRPGPPDGYGAASEVTLFCDRATLSVVGLMGDSPAALRGLPVPAGLVRVRVHAHDRGGPGERYEIFAWPVADDSGLWTLADDGSGLLRTPDPAAAATWAVNHLLATANPPATEVNLRRMSGEQPWRYPRVAIRRAAAGVGWDALGLTPDGDDLVLPVGEAELRFRPAPGGMTAWWAVRAGGNVAVPDPEPSTVELSEDGLVHRGVRAEDAVPLGLVWDHLLRRAGGPHPWEAGFAAAAAEAAHRAAEARRRRAASELLRWGGRMPSQRIRALAANTDLLWRLDPDLVETLAGATADTQRAVARWAARRACAVAGLDTVDWIAAALDTLDRDGPLPFGADALPRLLADPAVPHTTVRGPDGRPNCSRPAFAFPAVLAAASADPLVAAVDGLGTAAWAHGDGRDEFLASAKAFLETSSKG